jgi:hypothetical protein
MIFFSEIEPFLRRKQDALDVQDLVGLWEIRWRIGRFTLFSGSYTRVDQVFLIWGAIATVIFSIAQFFPYSWQTQAAIWSTLTLLGTCGMVKLTQFWVKVERLCWILYFWAGLMLTGLVLTDLSIFQGWGEVLIRLCPLWLGLCAVGYMGTGVGLRSRALLLTGLMHLAGIGLMPFISTWQFLATGLIMGCSLILLATCQWDMRPPIETDYLTDDQKQFNQQQQKLRQLEAQQNYMLI